jgi:hypothetical protein
MKIVNLKNRLIGFFFNSKNQGNSQNGKKKLRTKAVLRNCPKNQI